MLSSYSSIFGFCLWATFFLVIESCYDAYAGFGSTPGDFNLEVGKPLVITCTLYDECVRKSEKEYFANSSYLVFKLQIERSEIEWNNTQIVNSTTAQVTINESNVQDSGMYNCYLRLPDLEKDILVCGTKVSVGYKPQETRNLTCISRKFTSLQCDWRNVPNKVYTTSSLIGVQFNRHTYKCPNLTSHGNDHWTCEWTRDSTPSFTHISQYMEFIIITNNSLGFYEEPKRKIDVFEIAIPPKPKNSNVKNIMKNQVVLSWQGSRDADIFPPGLIYQVIYKSQILNSEPKVIYTGVIRSLSASCNITGLTPHTGYEFKIRCRSSVAKEEENMWSENETGTFKTCEDIPYIVPNSIREAFEVQRHKKSRAVTLYWKPVPVEDQNGENFQYVIKYSSINKRGKILYDDTNITSNPYITFNNLDLNTKYLFKIFSSNRKGISNKFRKLVIEKTENIPDTPEDITVTLQSSGTYEISWKPQNQSFVITNYTIFWCANLRSFIRRFNCTSPIEWYTVPANSFSAILTNVSDEQTNYQFAVSANSEHSSSGMKWASCIISNGDTISKPGEVDVKKISSEAIQVYWKLSCDAQKKLIKEYHILYCKAELTGDSCIGNEEKKIVNETTGKNSIIIYGLTPYTYYRICVRIVNKNGVEGDCDYKSVQTKSGVPSGPPEDIQITNFTNSTIDILWKSPEKPNGIITYYKVMYNNFFTIKSVTNHNAMNYRLTLSKDIIPYTNYSIQLSACVQDAACSNLSKPINVLTKIGVPGEMDAPVLKEKNDTHIAFSWKKPLHPNGPISYYKLYVYSIHDSNSTLKNSSDTIYGNETLYIFYADCFTEDKKAAYVIQIQPVNEVNDMFLVGPKTKPTRFEVCMSVPGLTTEMVIGIAVGGALGCAFILFVIYVLVKWMKKKLDMVRAIKVKLPNGLDTPDKIIFGYENFKKGLLQQNPNIPPIKQKPGSFILNSKSRHGSGHSLYSNISAEELLYGKSLRCGTYHRNPSGDSSSGCSSNGGHDSISSSNTNQTHLSTDSGTEVDLSPPITDNVFSDQNPILKTTLTNIKEVQYEHINNLDPLKKKTLVQSDLTNELQIKTDIESAKASQQYPYSKFGLKRGSLSYSRQFGMLAYASSLSNSEPSIAECDEGNKVVESFAVTLMPYSKLTFAKSLENLSKPCPMDILDFSNYDFVIDDKKKYINPEFLPSYTTVGFSNLINNNVTNSYIPISKGYIAVPSSFKNTTKTTDSEKTELSNKNSNDTNKNMAYSKFDIQPSLSNLRSNPKISDYIPFQQANFMLQSPELPKFNFHPAYKNKDDYTAESSPSGDLSIPVINLSEDINSSGQNDNCSDVCNEKDKSTISDTPLINGCDGNNYQNITAINEEKTEIKNCISDIVEDTDIHAENADEQQPKDEHNEQSDAVLPPKHTTGYVPIYRFCKQSDDTKTLKHDDSIHISPIYYV